MLPQAQGLRLRQQVDHVPVAGQLVLRHRPGRTDTASVMRPSGKRLDIQGLRALAVLLVVAFHAGLRCRWIHRRRRLLRHLGLRDHGTLVARVRRAPAGIGLRGSTRAASAGCCPRSPSCSCRRGARRSWRRPIAAQRIAADRRRAVALPANCLPLPRCRTATSTSRRRAQSAPAHLVAGGGGAVLPRLPGAPARRAGGCVRRARGRRARRRDAASPRSRSASSALSLAYGRSRRHPAHPSASASSARRRAPGSSAPAALVAACGRSGGAPGRLAARRRRGGPPGSSSARRALGRRAVSRRRRCSRSLGTCVLIVAAARAQLVSRAARARPVVWIGDLLVQLVPLALAADRLRRALLAGAGRHGAVAAAAVSLPGLALVPLRREHRSGRTRAVGAGGSWRWQGCAWRRRAPPRAGWPSRPRRSPRARSSALARLDRFHADFLRRLQRLGAGRVRRLGR